jgi:prepilin-type N-terminal cleavage/methylation domain-containing protein
MKPRNKRAFTLVEVLMVCLIVGLIATFAVPAITRAKRYQEHSEIVDKINRAILAFELYHAENGEWPEENVGSEYFYTPPDYMDYYFEYYGVDDFWGNIGDDPTDEIDKWLWYHREFDSVDYWVVMLRFPETDTNKWSELDRMLDDDEDIHGGVFRSYYSSPNRWVAYILDEQ